MKTNKIFLIIILIAIISIPAQSVIIQSKPNQDMSYNNPDINLKKLINKINETILEKHLEKIVSFGPHPTGSNELEQLGNYLFNTLESYNLAVKYDTWERNDLNGKNIIAETPGKKDGVILVCAHYDSVLVSPGACDDGSGVSAVLACAQMLNQTIFNCSIRFALFSGEEQGLHGSRSYAEEIKQNNEKLVGMIALDGIGYAETKNEGQILKHHANDQSKWMIDLSKNIADEYKELIDLDILDLPHVSFSDHQSFVEQGYDASYFFQYGICPVYHTSEDKLEYINLTYLKKIARLTLGTLTKMAEINPDLQDDDIEIKIKGSILSKPAQMHIQVINNKGNIDTVNLSIKIKMEYIFRQGIVQAIKESFTIPCNWSFQKEIKDDWVFETFGRVVPAGFFKITITVKGLKEDAHIYKSVKTNGLLIPPTRILMIPIN